MKSSNDYAGASVRRLTAPVSSAIAAIAIEGTAAPGFLSSCLLTPGGKPLDLSRAQVRFALWRFDDAKCPPEHVMVLVRSPAAFEIHCHGGLAVTAAIIDQLVRAGCVEQDGAHSTLPLRPVSAVDELHSQQLQEVFANEARIALAKASTLKTALILLDQYHGALINELRDIENVAMRGGAHAALEACDQVLSRSRLGQKLNDRWRLTLAGPPNVGKSSLMNALYGSSRVLVHHEPGTTRDAIETNLVIQDWPIVLVDTAGIRESQEAIEAQGIRIRSSALVCWRSGLTGGGCNRWLDSSA